LFEQALTIYPEPPNRSNLTLQQGHLPSLWAAAQQGLWLQTHHTDNSRSQLDEDASVSRAPGNTKVTAEIQPGASAAMSPVHTAFQSSSSFDVAPMHAPTHAAGTDQRSSTDTGATQYHHRLGALQDNAALAGATLANSPEDDSPTDLQCQLQPGVSSCWSSDSVGPSAASLLQKLRWVALGPQFNWSTRQYEHEPGVNPLPLQLVTLAQHVVKACEELHLDSNSCKAECADDASRSVLHSKRDCTASATCHNDAAVVGIVNTSNTLVSKQHVDCVPYEPNTALVNFYREGDTLGGHKDDAELLDTCPIVSLSLGCDGVFLMGGQTKDVAPTAIWLHSGDAVVLSGPARQCYHGVPRVMPGQLACELSSIGASEVVSGDILAYMQRTRVNISVRQT